MKSIKLTKEVENAVSEKVKELTKSISDLGSDVSVRSTLPSVLEVGDTFKVNRVALETTEMNGRKYGYFMIYDKNNNTLSVRRLAGVPSAKWAKYFEKVDTTNAMDFGTDLVKISAYLNVTKPTLRVLAISDIADTFSRKPMLFEVI